MNTIWWFIRDDPALCSFIAFAVLVLSFLVYAVIQTDNSYEQFMRECTADRKHWECEAIWRNSNESDTVIIPVYTPSK